jgi:hypothetical protein
MGLKRQALWSLAVLGAKDEAAHIAEYLRAADRPLRLRAALALETLGSPLVEKTRDWLTSSDRSQLLIAMLAIRYVLPQEKSKAMLFESRKDQTDPDLRRAIDAWLKRWRMLGGD